MAPPSVPSSPNPRLIRPTQPRGRWIHGLLSAGHAFPLLSRGGENHRLCFLRARKNRAGVPTYCHDTSRFSDLLLCPPPRRAIPCWSRTDLTAEGSRCRFDAHKRPRPRRATRASTQGRSHEVPSARERANRLSGAAHGGRLCRSDMGVTRVWGPIRAPAWLLLTSSPTQQV